MVDVLLWKNWVLFYRQRRKRFILFTIVLPNFVLIGLCCLLLDFRFDAVDRRIGAMRGYYEEQLLVNKHFKKEKQYEQVEVQSLVDAYDATNTDIGRGGRQTSSVGNIDRVKNDPTMSLQSVE